MHISKTPQRSDRLREEVFVIADALLKEGQRPTINKIAQRLGHGSNTTIGEALEAWWSLLHSRLENTFTAPAIDHEIIDLADILWKRAIEKSSFQYEEDKKQIQGTLATLQEQHLRLHAALEEQQQKFLLTKNSLEQLVIEKTTWEEQQKSWQAQIQKLETQNMEQADLLLQMKTEQQQSLLEQQKTMDDLNESLNKKILENQNLKAFTHQEKLSLLQQLKQSEMEALQLQKQVELLKDFLQKQEEINQQHHLDQKQTIHRLEQERLSLTKIITHLQKKAKLRRKFNPSDTFF